MPQNLEIRVLFCYSPEVLLYTYPHLAKLIEDNKETCQLIENTLNNNIDRTKYNVKTTYTDSVNIYKLQNQWYRNNTCLTARQLDNLTICTSSNAWYIKIMFGGLPRKILELKKQYTASVVILQVHTCNDGTLFRGCSAGIGITKPSETVISIGRSDAVLNMPTYRYAAWMVLHELGHLMGCRHPKGTGDVCDNSGGNAHGHWFKDPLGTATFPYGTIMSYAEKHILYYSNPNLLKYPAPYQNTPCGVIGVSEAYKTVNNNVQKLAGIFPP
ncbi:Zinc-dependent metalloprotease family protein [Candidatus Hepatincola sp. Av]